MNNEPIFAKYFNGEGVLISDHTKMVINLCMNVANNFKFYNSSDKDEFLMQMCVAALLHDIGKCSSSFQSFIKKQDELDEEGMETVTKKNLVHHNTYSWAFGMSCLNGMRKERNYPIRAAVLYHHTVKDDVSLTAYDIIKTMSENDAKALKSMREFYMEMCGYIKDTFNIDILSNKDFTLIEDADDYEGFSKMEDEPLYYITKIGDEKTFEINNRASLIRAIVVYADRTISSNKFNNSLILENNIEYIDSIYSNHCNTSHNVEADFSMYDQSRLSSQMSIADDIYNSDIKTNVIKASAGWGKTLFGLINYFKYGKKTMWVTPRTVIADSTYESIMKELNKMGKSSEVNVGLFYGNKFQKCNFTEVDKCEAEDCDILVIIIDAFLSRYSKNNMSTLLIDSYCGNVIFDEFHEFVGDEPLFAAFVNTVRTRKQHTDSNTLLLSATAINFDYLWNNKNIKYWDNISVYGGETKVKINYMPISSVSEAIGHISENSFTIVPTVRNAQLLYNAVDNEDTILIHSNYLPSDRSNIENALYKRYSKNTEGEDKTPVIGTSIIGTGLDISAMIINDFCLSPEDTIQRGCGRGGRFKEYEEIQYNVVDLNDNATKKFVGNVYDTNLRKKWIDMLKKYDGSVITKNDIYNLYREFGEVYSKELKDYYKKKYENSINELFKIKHKSGSVYVNDGVKICGGGFSYRGESDSFYATVRLDNGEYLEPMVCEDTVLYRERNTSENNKQRYGFMVSNNGYNFPDKATLKYAFGIKDKNEATKENCYSIASRSDRPMLLCDYKYSKKIGLYFNGD